MILLASASPRRRQLLNRLGLRFEAAPQAVDESFLPGENPRKYVERLAGVKAGAAIPRLRSGSCSVVLAADTAVVCDDRVLGKPENGEDAVAMLLTLSGRVHRVLTAVTVTDGVDFRRALSTSEVCFRPVSRKEALAYWHTGEPKGKAGAYAIQGRAAIFVSELRGSYSGVVGLPLFETATLLAQFGISCLPSLPPVHGMDEDVINNE